MDDDRIDREHYDAIARAADRWNQMAGGERFTIGPRGKCRIYVDQPPPGLLAEYRWRDGEAWIWLAPELLQEPLARFESVVMHELGHSERLDHLPGPGIMADADTHTDDFTTLDVEECRRAGLCR